MQLTVRNITTSPDLSPTDRFKRLGFLAILPFLFTLAHSAESVRRSYTPPPKKTVTAPATTPQSTPKSGDTTQVSSDSVKSGQNTKISTISPISPVVPVVPDSRDTTPTLGGVASAPRDSVRLSGNDSLSKAPDTGRSVAKTPIAPPAPPEAGDAAFELFEIEDEKLVRQLWEFAGRDSTPEPGRYQVLLVADTTPGAWLMREGTQVGSLPQEKMAWVRQRLHAGLALNDDGMSRTLRAGFWGNFWNPGDWVEPYQWKTGMEFNFSQSAAVFNNTSPLYGQQYDFTFAQRPDFWLTTEVGAHFSRQNGGLRRNLYNPIDSRPDWEPWGQYVPWWHAAIGVPGLKYEIALANRVFPDYYWLDPNAGEGTYKSGIARGNIPVDTSKHYEDGIVMRTWNSDGDDPKPSNTNIAQTLHVKAGNIRYSVHYDRDVYLHPIHQLLFDDLYAPFGQWAIGFVASGKAAHTRLRLDLFPWHMGVGSSAYGARARVYFLRVNIDYRNAETFRIALSTSVLFDGPFLRPGENP
jgi:hypothetical protein